VTEGDRLGEMGIKRKR